MNDETMQFQIYFNKKLGEWRAVVTVAQNEKIRGFASYGFSPVEALACLTQRLSKHAKRLKEAK